MQKRKKDDLHVENIKLDISSPAMIRLGLQILVQEEKAQLEKIKLTFNNSWREISLGERFMRDYMNFCQTKKEFTPDFFLSIAKQVRYYYLLKGLYMK